MEIIAKFSYNVDTTYRTEHTLCYIDKKYYLVDGCYYDNMREIDIFWLTIENNILFVHKCLVNILPKELTYIENYLSNPLVDILYHLPVNFNYMQNGKKTSEYGSILVGHIKKHNRLSKLTKII